MPSPISDERGYQQLGGNKCQAVPWLEMDKGSQIGLSQEDTAMVRKNRQLYLLASIGIIIIFAVCTWHFSAPAIVHFKARQAWKRDKASLAIAFSQMEKANLNGDLNSWLLASMNANGNLDALRVDIKDLSGTDDQYRREQFLAGAEDCLKFGFDVTPPPARHSDYCIHLIGQP